MMTDVNTFAHYGEQGCLALLSDSTNVEKEGYTLSDSQIGETTGDHPEAGQTGTDHHRPLRLQRGPNPAGGGPRRQQQPKNRHQRPKH